MNKKNLLDCTLRDGGYVNNWDYGYGEMLYVLNNLIHANVEYVEIGFLDNKESKNFDRSIQPSVDVYEEMYAHIDKKKTKLLAMVDLAANLNFELPPRNEVVDGIRIIFKKHQRADAIRYASYVKSKKYEVFLQLVSITSYSDEELILFTKEINELKPDAVSLVDTYGLLHKNDLLHYFDILDYNIKDDIAIGYHSHNNYQLGYSNCIDVINKKTKHSIIVDGTLFGMGKSAGNAPLELLANFLNDNDDKQYDVGNILEAIDSVIMKEYSKKSWGYSTNFFLSASNDCHPNYVFNLINRKTLPIKSVNAILSQIPDEYKLNYNESIIDKLYFEFQTSNKERANDIRLDKKPLLLLGPGASVKNTPSIRKMIDNDEFTVVHVNCYYPEYKADYIFISNVKRLNIINSMKKPNVPIIATSNVKSDSCVVVADYSELMSNMDIKIDSSLALILTYLVKLGIKKVSLAGFDGYSHKNGNYAEGMIEYPMTDETMDKVNDLTSKFINCIKKSIEIEFITNTKYRDDNENNSNDTRKDGI